MLLRHSLKLEKEAHAIESAITSVLHAGHRTADLIRTTQPALSTSDMGDLVAAEI
jgi:3-isopropylmalate dehydrogenase